MAAVHPIYMNRETAVSGCHFLENQEFQNGQGYYKVTERVKKKSRDFSSHEKFVFHLTQQLLLLFCLICLYKLVILAFDKFFVIFFLIDSLLYVGCLYYFILLLYAPFVLFLKYMHHAYTACTVVHEYM